MEAIEFASRLRARERKYKEFGAAVKEEFLYSIGESGAMIRVAQFEPEDYRLKAIETERKANRLSIFINAKNYAVELEFDGDKYF